MTADDTVDPAVAEGTDRRTALKKAAIAAGVVAWTTPAVQAVTARPAFAQTVTACAAHVLPIQAFLTGPNCKAVPGSSSASELLQRQHVLLVNQGHLRCELPRGATRGRHRDRRRHEARQLQDRPFPRRCLQDLDGHDQRRTSNVPTASSTRSPIGRPDHVYTCVPINDHRSRAFDQRRDRGRVDRAAL